MNRNVVVRMLRPRPAPLQPPASMPTLFGEGLDAIVQLGKSADRYWFDRVLRLVMPRFLDRDVILPTVEDRIKRYRDAYALFASTDDRRGFEYREIIGSQFQQAWRCNTWPTLHRIPDQMPRRQRGVLRLVRA